MAAGFASSRQPPLPLRPRPRLEPPASTAAAASPPHRPASAAAAVPRRRASAASPRLAGPPCRCFRGFTSSRPAFCVMARLAAPVRLLQSRFKTPDLLGRAARWLRKYPSCFELFTSKGPVGSGGELYFCFTKRMAELVDTKEAVVTTSEQAMADHLARILMLARGRRLPALTAATLMQAGSSQATALQSPWPRWKEPVASAGERQQHLLQWGSGDCSKVQPGEK